MTTCTFLYENKIIDALFYEHLQSAVMGLVQKHDALDFVFLREHGEIGLLTLCAVMEAKYAYPQKHIQITLLRDRQDNSNCMHFPSCVLDRVLLCDIPGNSSAMHHVHERITQFVIDRCDYIIYYHYPALHAKPFHQYVPRSNTTFIDLTQTDTTQFLHDCVAMLNPDEQWLKAHREQGVTLRELGEHFNRTGAAMALRLSKISRKLFLFASKRLREQGCTDVLFHPAVCCILSRSAIPERMLPNLTAIIAFIASRFRNKRHYPQFFIEQTACSPETILSLRKTTYTYSIETFEAEQRQEILAMSNFVCLIARQEQPIESTSQFKIFELDRPEPKIMELSDL